MHDSEDQSGRWSAWPTSLPDWLLECPLRAVTRIDYGLEGDWSRTVRTIWKPAEGLLDLEELADGTQQMRPCLELYLSDGWIGVHCCNFLDGAYRFNESKARRVVALVEAALSPSQHHD